MSIPRLIHQTCNSRRNLPDQIEESISNIQFQNPNWSHIIYDANDREDFIRTEYGKEFLDLYLLIDRKYGACRADFFRYLLMYKQGGVYLDIKSGLKKKLDEVLKEDDSMVVCPWPTAIENVNTSTWGIHRQLPIPEFQNWFLISSQNNSIMYEVIERVTKNLRDYRPFSDGVGRIGVLKISGPIIFTQTLIESKNFHSVRQSTNEELGLIYTVFGMKMQSIMSNDKQHYTNLITPIITKNSTITFITKLYFAPSLFYRRIFFYIFSFLSKVKHSL